jgi:hypothetical protein
MHWLRQILSRGRMGEELSEEMRQHLEEKIEALVAGGVSREEAVHAAHRAFGNATLIEQRSREVWIWPWLESLWGPEVRAARIPQAHSLPMPPCSNFRNRLSPQPSV